MVVGIEWKKIYTLTHPSDLGTAGFFKDLKDAQNKNAENETADMFSVLGELDQYRSCSGGFHFQLCYPELAENFSYPCNEWTQFSNPVSESIVKDFKPINITFNKRFNGATY